LKNQEKRRAKWIGDTIKKFSLGKQLPRKGRGKIRRYEFDPTRVNDVCARYGDD